MSLGAHNMQLQLPCHTKQYVFGRLLSPCFPITWPAAHRPWRTCRCLLRLQPHRAAARCVFTRTGAGAALSAPRSPRPALPQHAWTCRSLQQQRLNPSRCSGRTVTIAQLTAERSSSKVEIDWDTLGFGLQHTGQVGICGTLGAACSPAACVPPAATACPSLACMKPPSAHPPELRTRQLAAWPPPLSSRIPKRAQGTTIGPGTPSHFGTCLCSPTLAFRELSSLHVASSPSLAISS
jgi:hypothetical protein